MKTDLDALHRFFADFYAAAADRSWTAMCAASSELLTRPRVSISVVRRGEEGRLVSTSVGNPADRVRQYLRQIQPKDVLFQRIRAIEPNCPRSRDSIIAWDELRKTEVYNEFHRPVGIENLHALAVDDGPLRLIAIIFQNKGERLIDDQEVRAFAQLAPHLKTALRLSQLRSEAPLASPVWTMDRLRQTYGLTPSEARVALLLCAGLPAKRVVSQLGLRPSSIHTQVKSIFAKTDTHSQVELVHLLLSTGSLQ